MFRQGFAARTLQYREKTNAVRLTSQIMKPRLKSGGCLPSLESRKRNSSAFKESSSSASDSNLSFGDLKIPRNELVVVFDMNGVLLHRAKSPVDFPSDGRVGKRHVYLRPFTQNLLRGRYGYWTSANHDNALQMAKMVGGNPLFVWSRDKCTPFPQGENPWSVKKDLKALFSFGLSPENVLLVDDTEEKIMAGQEDNHLLVPAFYPGRAEDKSLDSLLEDARSHFSVHKDIRLFVREQKKTRYLDSRAPFGHNSTALHSDAASFPE